MKSHASDRSEGNHAVARANPFPALLGEAGVLAELSGVAEPGSIQVSDVTALSDASEVGVYVRESRADLTRRRRLRVGPKSVLHASVIASMSARLQRFGV